MYVVGSHYAANRQMEAYCFRISGESQNPRIRMLELEGWVRSPVSLDRQGPSVFIVDSATEAENSATRQQGWVCDIVTCDLVTPSWEGVMPRGWGYSRSTLYRPLAGDRGLPRVMARLWGILSAAGEGL